MAVPATASSDIGDWTLRVFDPETEKAIVFAQSFDTSDANNIVQ
jgi:hypothetical protein